MQSEAVPMLFLPPWDPVALRSDRKVVIGRSPSCDLPVASAQVSRRHAWVHHDGNEFVVSDLGSTNGTYVNEEQVRGARPLSTGDRIRVGDHTVTYCIVDPSLQAAPDFDACDTLVFSGDPRESAQDALQGDLGQIPAFAVLQMLELGQKSGMLALWADSVGSRFWLEQGRPVHAEHGGAQGLEAALEIARLAAGRFSFEPSVDAPEQTIRQSLAEILLEASRQLDESVRTD